MTFFNEILTWAWKENNNYIRWASIRLLGGLTVLVIFGWLCNISGFMAVNLIPLIFGTLFLTIVGTSPLAIALSALSGKLLDEEKANQFLANVWQTTNPLSNASEGIKFWVTRILPNVIYYLQIIFGLLATWSFASDPIMFWYVAGFSIVMLAAMIATQNLEGSVLYRIVMTYSVIVILYALGSTAWKSFDVNLEEDVLYQSGFDSQSGEPLKMGYYTPLGCDPAKEACDWIEDPLGRTPADCRLPDASGRTLPHFYADGSVYPYETHGTCRSPKTGKRLVPISPEYVPDTTRTTLPGMVDGLFKTQKERESAAAAREREAAKAEAREIRKAAAVAAAGRPVVVQQVVAPPPPRTQATNASVCGGAWKNQLNCESVLFGNNQQYDREKLAGHCLVADPYDAVQRVSLGGDQVRFIPNHSGVRVRFFDLPVNETFYGVTC